MLDRKAPQSPHDTLCQAIGILQEVYLAKDSANDGNAVWPVFYMPSAALEAAINMLVSVLPDLETVGPVLGKGDAQ